MLIVLLSCLIYFAAPLLVSYWVAKRIENLSIVLFFTTSFILQQIFLILISKIVKDYLISLIISEIILFGGVISLRSWLSPSVGASENKGILRRIEDIIPILIFITIGGVYLFIRCHYPFIAFINNGNEAGVEKLYNLSLQQSFLFGSGWPTEWVWLAGEPINYYVFLRSIPGIISSIGREVFHDTTTGGMLFILSEVFYAALTPAIISALILWFLRDQKRNIKIILAVFTPLIGFLGVHFKGLKLGLSALFSGAALDWWSLPDQVIPFTQSQYPEWLMLLGDNHAYSQVYFLQMLFIGGVLELITRDGRSILLSMVVGMLGSAVLLSHPGSILIDISILSPFIAFTLLLNLIRDKKCFLLKVQNISILSLTALVVIVLGYQKAGNVKVVYPSASLLTTPLQFLSQNFSILIFLILLTLPFLSSLLRSRYGELKNNFKELFTKHRIVLILSMVGIAISVASAHEAVAMTIVLSTFVYILTAPKQFDSTQLVFSLFAMCAFFILIPPEIIAFDHVLDNRTDWIRFQMALRFWPESYMIIPFALSVAFGKSLSNLNKPRSMKFLTAFFAIFVITLCCSHIPGIKNRISRSTQSFSLDGFNEFYKRYPSDTKIVQYLRNQPNRELLIGELCSVYGTNEIPAHFGWSGRIAAFSGRRGVCGWGRHAALYNTPLKALGWKGMAVEQKVDAFAQAYLRILNYAQSGDKPSFLYIDKELLRTYNVTHLIFGEEEKMLFPQLTVDRLAQALQGTVSLKNSDDTGIVEVKSS